MLKRYPERVIHHSVLTLRYFKSDANRLPSQRLRVVISTKIAKKATIRNLIRRRVKEVWRQLSIPTDLVVAIYTKSAILDKSFAEIKTILTNISKQLN
ncbi:ribonuclease P protein component [Patescibacteria group bacterium]|nr:ribonuclease P protein component [Patescibacteria group bacterium]